MKCEAEQIAIQKNHHFLPDKTGMEKEIGVRSA